VNGGTGWMIMPTANSPASNEVVTAALLVIGGKIPGRPWP